MQRPFVKKIVIMQYYHMAEQVFDITHKKKKKTWFGTGIAV